MNTPNPAPVTTTAEDAQEVAADLRKLIDSAPAYIWLDLGEGLEALTDEGTFRDLREVSWSEDNATGVGIKYVRAPVADATSDAALLPCPFCGGPATMIDRLSGPLIPGAFVSCDACDISTPIRETLGECSADWNRRAALPIDFKQATDQGGWQLVPIEPTETMLDEGWNALDAADNEGDFVSPDGIKRLWRAMLAAPTLLGVADGDAVGGKSGGAK